MRQADSKADWPTDKQTKRKIQTAGSGE